MAVKFKGCAVYIYDMSGKLLAKSTVLSHDTANSTIFISSVPELSDQTKYNLLILTAPSPHAFSCITDISRQGISLKLFRGEQKEQRSNERYVINGSAGIAVYVCDGKTFNLHTPQDAQIVNISKGGVRLKMKPKSLSLDDVVQINVKTGAVPKVLTAHVVNLQDNEKYSEYGCKLV